MLATAWRCLEFSSRQRPGGRQILDTWFERAPEASRKCFGTCRKCLRRRVCHGVWGAQGGVVRLRTRLVVVLCPVHRAHLEAEEPILAAGLGLCPGDKVGRVRERGAVLAQRVRHHREGEARPLEASAVQHVVR